MFGLGGSQKQSTPPILNRTFQPAAAPASHAVLRTTTDASGTAARAASTPARISTAAPLPVRLWGANDPNTALISGQLLLGGKPVQGAAMEVDDYTLQKRTNADGRFSYLVDTTIPRRHIVHVVRLANATVNGRALTAAERTALIHASGAFNVAYQLSNLRVSSSNGHVVVTGRISYANGQPAPPVVLYTYRLSGTITDAAGHPVAGATVVTRTQDRNFWTFSTPSDANGHYASFFTASDQAGEDPVPLTVQVASGAISYASPNGKNVNFGELHSATMNIRLPSSPSAPLALPTATSYAGAIYEGTIVGVSGPSGVVTPVSATWPTTKGDFRLVLPGSVRGKPLRLWEESSTFFQSSTARPGGAIELSAWPHIPPGDQPQELAVVQG